MSTSETVSGLQDYFLLIAFIKAVKRSHTPGHGNSSSKQKIYISHELVLNIILPAKI